MAGRELLHARRTVSRPMSLPHSQLPPKGAVNESAIGEIGRCARCGPHVQPQKWQWKVEAGLYVGGSR